MSTELDSDTGSKRLREPSTKSTTQGIGEWIAIVIAALLVALVVRTYVVQTFWIPSESMERTLLVHDRVLVNKLAFRFGDVHRGDVVVFKRPPAETDPNIKDLIKRVIGMPGDIIEANSTGQVLINGRPLSEPYLAPGTLTDKLPPTKVPPNSYFLLGDNRTYSKDSRYFQAVPKSLLVGKASVRIWPPSRISSL